MRFYVKENWKFFVGVIIGFFCLIILNTGLILFQNEKQPLKDVIKENSFLNEKLIHYNQLLSQKEESLGICMEQLVNKEPDCSFVREWCISTLKVQTERFSNYTRIQCDRKS